MSAHPRKDQVSLLDFRIDILDRNAAGSPPAKEVFKTVSTILALVRDKTIANRDSVQLSDHCFTACEALQAAIEEGNTNDLDTSVRIALEDLVRVTSEIERTLRRGASTPHIKYNNETIKRYKLEIQDILDDLNRPSPSFNKDDTAPERTTQLPPVASGGAAATPVSEYGAFERLIRRKFVQHELPSLIEEILVCKDVVDMTRSLPREDAQTFIDLVDEALDMPDLSPWAQNQCLRPLYRTCGGHALLPKSMKIHTCYDRTSDALYSGGYADVWKGQHCGRDVAVKVLRTFSNSDFGKVIGRFCKEAITWKNLHHPNVLPLIGVTMTEVKFAMISDWMANGNLNEFVEANPDADRLKLLGDTARGLIYIHERGVVHGDLKGANIMIDQTCHARLADFGLHTVISDPANLLPSSSYAPGGTARWMSPERISPQDFGLKTSRPSKSSDCYSLGMVVYETIAGNLPFHEDRDLTVFVKVLKGERPRREVGFADSMWDLLERCWVPQPSDRPSVEDVLQCLEMCSDKVAEGTEGNLGFDGLITPPGEQGDYSSYDTNTPPIGRPSELKLNKKHSPPPTGRQDGPPAPSLFPVLTVSDVLPPLDTAILHAGSPVVNISQDTTSGPQLHVISEAPVSRVMSQTAGSVDNLGESIALNRHVRSEGGQDCQQVREEAQASPDSSTAKQKFLHPTEPISSIYRGYRRRNSSGSRDRGGIELHSAPGSSRASPYPSPQASPLLGYGPLPSIPSFESLLVSSGMGSSRPVSIPAYGASLFGLPPGSIGELGHQLDTGTNLTDTEPLKSQSAPSNISPTFVTTLNRLNVTPTATAKVNKRRRKTDVNFACPVPGCGSAFFRRFHLKGHMREHNEEKPFQCRWPGCGKGFARAHDCKRHEQLHNSSSNRKCEVCAKSFQKLDALKRHLRPEGGEDCQKAVEAAQAAITANFAGLGSGNSMASGPPDSDSAGSFLAMNLDNSSSTGGNVYDSVEAEPDNWMSGVSMVLDA